MLLTISIPTYNRYDYLEKNLKILSDELKSIENELCEILVFDNNEGVDKPPYIDEYISSGVIKYIKNIKNIGSDANIAQAYDSANSEYVLVLGDDDFFLPGKIVSLLKLLKSRKYDIILLRACGYDIDYIGEVPNIPPNNKIFTDPRRFIKACGASITLISSLVIRKQKIRNFNTSKYIGSNLVQTGVFLEALSTSIVNLRTIDYYLSVKRNNSGGYNSDVVFIDRLDAIFLRFLANDNIFRMHRLLFDRMLLSFFPQRIFVDRLKGKITRKRIGKWVNRFNMRPLFWILIYPTMILPRPLAISYGWVSAAVGRIISGDLRRLLKFVITSISITPFQKGKKE